MHWCLRQVSVRIASQYAVWFVKPLSYLGIVLDEALNRAGGSGMVTAIHSAESRVQILIIPTNEELEIAEQTAALLTAGTVS